MKRARLLFILPFFVGLTLIASCKPINIFSPFVDPSKMGNEAKLEAGYNALAEGDYDEAIEYFSDIIDSASGDDLTDAYIGRAAAYMNIAAPNLLDVVEDVIEGELEFENPGDVIGELIVGNEYDDFFDSISNAADDYNAAIDTAGSDIDRGILVEAYEANMMAATGVGSTRIAMDYNNPPWNDSSEAGLNLEIGVIVDADPSHPFHIDTWEDPTPSNNGLRQYVDGSPDKSEMLGYLQNAFDALTLLEDDPPVDMDVVDLKQGINNWVTRGLNEAPLS